MPNRSPEEALAKVREVFGDKVDVKPIHEPVAEDSENEVVDLLTKVCYFYPQYNLEQADSLTNAQVAALILQAEKQRAIDWYNQTLIAAAPHSKKGQLVSKLTKHYKKIAEM